MTKRVEVAEKLTELLQEYASDIENESHEQHMDCYIIDQLCDMHELLHKDGSEEGRFYDSFMLVTNKTIKLYDVVEVERFMSGTKDKLKVMAILEVKPMADGQLSIEFLAAKV